MNDRIYEMESNLEYLITLRDELVKKLHELRFAIEEMEKAIALQERELEREKAKRN